MHETVVLYTLSRETDQADFFTDLELLWKSFVFSYHNVAGKCTRDGLYTFIDPSGNKYTVRFAKLYREVIHL